MYNYTICIIVCGQTIEIISIIPSHEKRALFFIAQPLIPSDSFHKILYSITKLREWL